MRQEMIEVMSEYGANKPSEIIVKRNIEKQRLKALEEEREALQKNLVLKEKENNEKMQIAEKKEKQIEQVETLNKQLKDQLDQVRIEAVNAQKKKEEEYKKNLEDEIERMNRLLQEAQNKEPISVYKMKPLNELNS